MMAPFGKNFLKTRLKSRTKDAEPVVGKEIQVTVCKEEKVVCGVTKHTTCADMVQALLEDHRAAPESKRLLHGDPKDFCLLERWKGFERALPPLTRILRLWNAWGDQKPFIQFVLVKTSDFVAQPAAACGGKKVTSSKAGTRPKRWEQHQQHQQGLPYSQSLPVERQKRMVKKAFRKLEKLNKSSSSSSPPGTEDIDRMVQLILTQDHSIRGQIQRMRELDLDIERLELQAATPAGVHRGSPGGATEAEEQLMMMQEFVYTSDGLEQLEEQVHRHQELIRQLSRDIDAELRSRLSTEDAGAPRGQEEEECGAAGATSSEADAPSPLYAAELQRLQAEMTRSLFAGVSLYAQTTELDKELTRYETSLVAKDQECWQLAAQLRTLLQLEDGGGAEEEEETPGSAVVALLPKSHVVQQCGALSLKHSLSSPTTDVTDTDSDTGISSTHSQDSLSPCLDFPPPLDTDV